MGITGDVATGVGMPFVRAFRDAGSKSSSSLSQSVRARSGGSLRGSSIESANSHSEIFS